MTSFVHSLHQETFILKPFCMEPRFIDSKLFPNIDINLLTFIPVVYKIIKIEQLLICSQQHTVCSGRNFPYFRVVSLCVFVLKKIIFINNLLLIAGHRYFKRKFLKQLYILQKSRMFITTKWRGFSNLLTKNVTHFSAFKKFI